MDELNYKAAYLYLVGAVDDVIRSIECDGAQTEPYFLLARLQQALAAAEERAIG